MNIYLRKFIYFILISLSAIEAPISVCSDQKLPSEAPIFVFDLNGVLFDTNPITVLRQIGIKDVLWYLARYRSAHMLKSRFYDTLYHINGTRSNTLGVKDTDNVLMPQIMVDWLQGTHENKTILKKTIDAINAHPQWFLSTTEQRLMAAMAQAIFDPEKFVASRKFLDDLVPLIASLKQRGAKLYVLSNWDKESFILLQQQYRDFFAQFDGCIISGNVGTVKPASEMFTHILHKTATAPICFFDDQHENLVASKKVNWHPICVSKTSSLLGSKIDIDLINKQLNAFLQSHNSQKIVLEPLYAA